MLSAGRKFFFHIRPADGTQIGLLTGIFTICLLIPFSLNGHKGFFLMGTDVAADITLDTIVFAFLRDSPEFMRTGMAADKACSIRLV